MWHIMDWYGDSKIQVKSNQRRGILGVDSFNRGRVEDGGEEMLNKNEGLGKSYIETTDHEN